MVALASSTPRSDEEHVMTMLTTTRFGEITVPADQFIELPGGLLGFETTQQYCLLESSPGSPLQWLQATTDPTLAFVVVNPYAFFPDYAFSIDDADVERLGLQSPEEVATLTLVSINERAITTNLLGPIVINRTNRRARQLVLTDSPYTTRHPLLPSTPAA